MKKLLVSVLAIAGLVACSQDTTLVQNSNNGTLMEFNVAALDNATRVDPSITVNTLNGFDVWAYVDSKGGTVLKEERVSLVNGAWSYVNKQYWSPEHNYYFTAIAPVDTNNWTNNWEYNQANDTIAFTNVDGTEDLLLATKTVSTHNTEIGQSMPAVGLQFNHLLSKVRFTFKNNFTTDNVFVEVEGVEFEVPATGTYSTVDGTWANLGGDATLEFGNVAMLGMGQSGTASDTEGVKNDRFVIPTSDQCKVSFTIKHYNGNVLVGKYEKESTITGVTFEKGKAYNFVAAFDSTNVADTALASIEFTVEGVDDWVQVVEANDAADIQQIINAAEGEVEIVLSNDIDLNEVATRAAGNATIVVPAGKVVTIDLNGKTLYATEAATKNYELIKNQGTLTVKNGNMWVMAENNRQWNAYSAVIANTVGGNLTVDGVNIEHKGGTDMAYGIDNLTNGKGTYAVTTIKNSTVKSSYRAVRQFLNGIEATNELYVEAGAVLEGANKSIFFHDPSNKANTGKLVVEAGAQLKGDVYLFVTAGSTEWPVEVSIASSALVGGSQVLSGNVPAGYDVVEKDGNYVIEYGVEDNGNEISISNAGGLKWVANQVNSGADYFEGKTIVLTADVDLKGEEWTPIGSAYMDHGFMGNFDGNGFVIKNLAIENIALDTDGYAYAGLFGVTEGVDKDNQNYIKNLVIENVNINTNGHIVAAAIAYPYYTVVENVTVKGNISIKGGDYTAGVLAYTRRCVDAKNLTIAGNNGSVVEGNITIGGVISDIQMNGGLTANYSNFKTTGVTVKGAKNVGGISGIICLQTLDGATVENVAIVCDDTRKGIVAGSLGGDSTINRVSVNNVSGADYLVGPLYGTKGHTVTIDGVVYEYLADGSIMIDGKLSVANGVLADDAAYYISNKAGMFWFANEVNVKKNAFDGKTVKLTADVDLNNELWTPVGQTGVKTFNGVFDGQNYTIYNLNVDSSSQTGAYYSSGLFGWVETHSEGKGILKNVKIENATIKGNHNCGALVGYITEKYARVQNCHVVNAAIECHYANGDADGDKAGALIGNATNATLVDGCSATDSTVSAGRDAGQLIGAAKLENVTNCSATNVTVTDNGEGTGKNIRNEVVGRVL